MDLRSGSETQQTATVICLRILGFEVFGKGIKDGDMNLDIVLVSSNCYNKKMP